VRNRMQVGTVLRLPQCKEVCHGYSFGRRRLPL
jgi:hypothetical protein